MEGYYDLEEIERNVAMGCLTRHPVEVQLWYRALTHYARAMTRRWNFSGASDPDEIAKARSLQVQLLGVNLGLAKSCLDNLMAGYYSSAYATIRHMIESCMHVIYFAILPDQASERWRSANTIRSQVKRRSRKIDPRLGTTVERLYNQWVKVSIGAHPSVETLRSSESGDGDSRIFGANYVEEMFLFGADQGLYAIGTLLNWFRVIGAPSSDWIASLDQWMDDVEQWRTVTIAPNVSEKGEWIEID